MGHTAGWFTWGDSGPLVEDHQVALTKDRKTELIGSYKTHAKDHHSRRGLLMLVGRRRSLLDYLKSRDVQRYAELIKRLNIRK